MKISHIFSLFFSIFVLFSAVEIRAQDANKIAAIVNDDIITVYDLTNRVRFMIMSGAKQNSAAELKRLENQALKDLIDEQLKIQVAAKSNITVSPESLDREVASIAKRNNLTEAQFKQIFVQNKVDIATLKKRVESGITWQRYTARELRRKVRISNDQINDELNIIKASQDQKQKRIFEIFLPIDNIEQELETKETIKEIQQLLRNGSEFTSLARTYSKAPNSNIGGDKGWLSAGQIEADLDEVIQELKVGEISDPVETLTGIYIFKVQDERSLLGDPSEITLTFVQIAANNTAVGRQKLRSIQESKHSCKALENIAAEDEALAFDKINNIKLADIMPNLQSNFATLFRGDISSIVSVGESIAIFSVCKRKDPKSNLPSRSDIRRKLLADKIEVMARQVLRDLRNNAFIDLRNKK